MTRIQHSEAFECVSIDVVGPLPESGGKKFVLSVMDQFTRWIELYPLMDDRAEEVADTLFEEWICRYGAPRSLMYDGGASFRSALFSRLLTRFGISMKWSTAYAPQTIGKNARFHRLLKSSIREIGRTH